MGVWRVHLSASVVRVMRMTRRAFRPHALASSTSDSASFRMRPLNTIFWSSTGHDPAGCAAAIAFLRSSTDVDAVFSTATLSKDASERRTLT